MIFSEPAPIDTTPVQVTAEQDPQTVDNGNQSGGNGSSGSEDRDEPTGQLAEPTIITIPSEEVEETETSRRENVQIEEAEETETSRHENFQVEEAEETETSRHENVQVEEAEETETSRHENFQVEEVEETETTRRENIQVEEAEGAETSRHEREAELSDVEEKGYCDFRSEGNIEMNLELVCVESEEMKLLYRNTERVRSYYVIFCN